MAGIRSTGGWLDHERPGDYKVNANPTPDSYSLDRTLPTGLAFDPSTGVISGTLGQARVFALTVGATNTGGTGTMALTGCLGAESAACAHRGQTFRSQTGQFRARGFTAATSVTKFEHQRGSPRVYNAAKLLIAMPGTLPEHAPEHQRGTLARDFRDSNLGDRATGARRFRQLWAAKSI